VDTYLKNLLTKAAEHALAETDLNQNATMWAEHVVRLVDDFQTTIETYIDENAPDVPTE